MKLLIWHGYLLSGTGSNVYVSQLSRQLCRQGHQVLLSCQEYSPENYDFISQAWRGNPDGSFTKIFERQTSYPGKCYFFRPHIGKILPVYVTDKYRNFIVKNFLDLDERQLNFYMDSNRRAARFILKHWNVEAILTNHALPLPATLGPLAKLFNLPMISIIHGSSIDFVASKNNRYQLLALKGLEAASTIVVMSSYSREQVANLGNILNSSKIVTVPCGVNTKLFYPQLNKPKALREFKEAIDNLPPFDKNLGYRQPDADLKSKIAKLSLLDKLVVFLGKLMGTKGVQILIAASPLILSKNSNIKLVVAGFGDLRSSLENFIAAIANGNWRRLLEIAKEVDEKAKVYPYLSSYFNGLEATDRKQIYLEAASNSCFSEQIIFTGLLDQNLSSYLLRASQLMVVPSVETEAFGMVTVEGLASGLLLLVAEHSGLSDILKEMRKAAPGIDFSIKLERDKAVDQLAKKVNFMLSLPEAKRQQIVSRLQAVSRRLYCWEVVSKKIIRLAEIAKAA